MTRGAWWKRLEAWLMALPDEDFRTAAVFIAALVAERVKAPPRAGESDIIKALREQAASGGQGEGDFLN